MILGLFMTNWMYASKCDCSYIVWNQDCWKFLIPNQRFLSILKSLVLV